MAKGRIQLRLSENALTELERRAKEAGVTRQAFIEAWLTMKAMVAAEPSLAGIAALSDVEIQKRMDRDKPGMINAAAHTFCPRHRPKPCPQGLACPHRMQA